MKAKVSEICQVLNGSPKFLLEEDHGVISFPVPSINSSDVTAIELFAGAGGLALGLEQAGIKTLEFV